MRAADSDDDAHVGKDIENVRIDDVKATGDNSFFWRKISCRDL
jgi:hypothetical protein